MDVVVGEICHIKGRSENGPRYDRTQGDAERNGYENLLVMCGAHNKIVDDIKTRDKFPVELLRKFKQEHESKHHNTLVNEAALQSWVIHYGDVAGSVITTHHQSGGQNAHTITNIFSDPPKPKAALTPVVTSLPTKADHERGLDFYDFRVELRNDGTKTVRDFTIEVEIPQRYMENAGSYAAHVNSRRPGETHLFRHTQKNFRDFALYPGDSYPVFSLSFILKKEHYLQGIRESIKVYVYSEDEAVGTREYPISGLLNAERVEHIYGPRLTAIKKIYQATRAF